MQAVWKKKKTNPKTLALRTGNLGWLVLVEVGRTASWPEHPSDCPVLTPPAPPYLEPTAPASQKQSREPVPWGYSCILTPLQATRLGRAAGSRTATCSSQSSGCRPAAGRMNSFAHAVRISDLLVQALPRLLGCSWEVGVQATEKPHTTHLSLVPCWG